MDAGLIVSSRRFVAGLSGPTDKWTIGWRSFSRDMGRLGATYIAYGGCQTRHALGVGYQTHRSMQCSTALDGL